MSDVSRRDLTVSTRAFLPSRVDAPPCAPPNSAVEGMFVRKMEASAGWVLWCVVKATVEPTAAAKIRRVVFMIAIISRNVYICELYGGYSVVESDSLNRDTAVQKYCAVLG